MTSRSALPLIALLCLVAVVAPPARAWDGPTHMAVAGIAYDHLTPAERRRLVAIVKKHPDVARLTTALGTPASGRSLVMAAATWPDLIKQDRTHFRDNGYNEAGPITAVVNDGKMHKGWHFIDIPISRDWDRTPMPPAPTANTVDAVTVVGVLVRQLGGGEPAAQKAYDVYWLLHLVGDIHQPLHCATGVDVTYPNGDTGGNDVDVSAPGSGESELHAYWDDILGKGQGGAVADIAVANQIIRACRGATVTADASSMDPAAWAAESTTLAKDDVYKMGDPASLHITTVAHERHGVPVFHERFTLDSQYHDQAVRVGRAQVQLAGLRLAAVLRPILDPH